MTRAQGGIRAWLAAIVVAGATLFIAPTAAHASGAGTLVADINAARASAGLGRLVYDGSLSGVAQAWANHMAATDTLAHNPSTPSQIRAGWSAWGENVGFTTTGSASTLHRAFMASPGHRANILKRSFTSLGVGWATKNGHTYVAEVFAAYPGAGSSGSGSSSSKASASKSSKASTSKSRASTSAGGSGASTSGTQGTSSNRAASSGAATSSARTTTPTTTPTPVHPDGLVLGDTGAKVRAMQVRLGVHGHAVRADGVFGPVTDRAVRAFQHDARLRVDGIVGAKTHAALAKPAPKKTTPKKTTAATRAPVADEAVATPTTTTPDPAMLLALARDRAAARSETSRTPPPTALTSTAAPAAFASPVAFTEAAGSTTGTATTDAPRSETAVALAALLTLAAALAAAGAWVLRRRRAG